MSSQNPGGNRYGRSSSGWNERGVPVTELSDSLRSLVGGRTATALDRAFDMATVEDLLRHYPRR
jgi:hypothetical protein